MSVPASGSHAPCLRRAARLFRPVAALTAALLALLTGHHALGQSYAEEEVKAAYIYHFGTYVEWPGGEGEAEAGGATPITIAVLGDEGVFEQLSRYLAGRRIGGRDVRVREIFSVDELGGDEILFIGQEQNRLLDTTIAEAEAPGRLIVTDTPAGLRPGAAINFRRADDRVQFEIANTAASAANLTLSSRLLASAMSVDGEPNR